jgi:hypothetical protein
VVLSPLIVRGHESSHRAWTRVLTSCVDTSPHIVRGHESSHRAWTRVLTSYVDTSPHIVRGMPQVDGQSVCQWRARFYSNREYDA